MPFDIILLIAVLAVLLTGVPVGLALGGTAVLVALIAWMAGAFDIALFLALPNRLFGIMTNSVLIAIPLFIFMGLVLERTAIAANMLAACARLFGSGARGMAISVMVVGTLLAASTGIVGATVVTLGLIALPTLLSRGAAPHVAAGTVAAAGTLGQIIPPSIVLIVLGDQMSNAWQKVQTDAGNFAPETVSVADLFAAALVPGLLLALLFIVYLALAPALGRRLSSQGEVVAPLVDAGPLALVAPALLIVGVLGSILAGFATPSEAGAVGAVAALILGMRRLNWSVTRDIVYESAHLTSVIFLIVIGASFFSLIFRGLGGDETLTGFLTNLPGGTYGALLVVMLVIFVLGFFLEFLEIVFVVVPLVAPILLALPMPDGSAMSPVWLAVLIALNLQTSFLTPPLGVSLFYLQSVAPPTVSTVALYRGVVPFVALQLVALAIVIAFPWLATALPGILFAN